MSAIAGIFQLDGEPVPIGHVQHMTAHMQQRGPDGIQHWQQGPAALGHCLLHTTPESLEENQPLGNEDGSLVLVMDGRVDNWLELRAELLQQGAVLRTRADAELVLRAFEIWGESCLQHITGDFALLLWQVHDRKLFAARDRTGSKSLFYMQDGHRLLFATDVAALLATPGVPRRLNEALLHELLGSCVSQRHQTLWEGILAVPPATLLQVGNGGLHLSQYWQPDPAQQLPCRTDADHVAWYRELLTDTVRRQSRSQVPLAIEVSGGLDSSGVFAVAMQLQREGRLLAPGIEAWTLGGLSGEAANEVAQVHALERFWQTSIHSVDALYPALDWFSQQARQWQDFPGYPNGAMMEPLLASVAGKGSRVVLNGLGGDEWLWGSRRYYAEALCAGDLRLLWDCLRRDAVDEGWRSALFWLVRHGAFGLLPVPAQARVIRTLRRWRGTLSEGRQRSWLAAAVREELPAALDAMLASSLLPEGKPQRLAALDDPPELWARQSVDREYALHGLEPRSPLYTAELIQFSATVPEHLLMRGSSPKWLHVEALRVLLPAEVAGRKRKADFSSAFQRPLDSMQHYFCRDLPALRPAWVDASGVTDLYQRYHDGREGGWPQWHLWTLAACDSFVTSVAEATPGK
jgi:asparagine synthase (glutamine-hydrolysing)